MKKTPALRPLRFRRNYLPHAEGSCLVWMGQTTAVCVASVEETSPPHAQEKGTGWVTAEYSMLPRAGEKRSSRSKVSSGGRAQEISRLIGRSLRACVDLKALAPYSILIDCDVIRADGGTRTASINGAFVALAQAVKRLLKEGKISESPIKHHVGAVSVGIIKNKMVLDMSYEHDKNAETDLNVVMTDSGDLVEIQATAEGAPFSHGQLKSMLALAEKGISRVIAAQKKVLKS